MIGRQVLKLALNTAGDTIDGFDDDNYLSPTLYRYDFGRHKMVHSMFMIKRHD